MQVDRLILHQFDPARPSPGGIDTCIRGLLKYQTAELVAVVGVDATLNPARQLGVWERHQSGDRHFYFMPVARLDPVSEDRKIPHSLQLVIGYLRYARHQVEARILQTHRVDTATAMRVLRREELAYFIHTQESGLTTGATDSVWRFAKGLHHALERALIRTSTATLVFNPDFAESAARISSRVSSFPTWYDEDLFYRSKDRGEGLRLVWVGRLESPKDPILALKVFKELRSLEPDKGWVLDLVGTGSLMDSCRSFLQELDPSTRSAIVLRGRLTPEMTAATMRSGSVLLMTSHPGYEGFPRVLVEALACGLPGVVTAGSDSGHILREGATGFEVAGRAPQAIAQRVAAASHLDSEVVGASVANLSASRVVAQVVLATRPRDFSKARGRRLTWLRSLRS